ncbi:hypothetical protein [Bacillus benzoevorans]|uniref:Uncharacterized protein n=1 Tax=Bacillus benzoevorans TaxID=1456 RepID=A0A7X0HUF7_9BACI|nr:hypothetical protein [Bacillus benzoevorans]MBB6447082.1 hypothetical protein [Bacillus benzoevorans]
MKIAYQVKLGDPVSGEMIGRNVWFPDVENAISESYVLMEKLEEQYGSFLIWDASIPFRGNKENSKIVVLQGIMPAITTKERPFTLQINREHVSDEFTFAEPDQTVESLSSIQIQLRKNMGRYFTKLDKSELEAYRRER